MNPSVWPRGPRVVVLVALTSGFGCGSGGGGGAAAEASCVAVETRSLAWSELSPLGFSADGLLRAIGSEHETRLTRADGTSTGLTLGLVRVSAGSVAFQTRERASTAGGPADAGTPCSDAMSVPVTLSFTTNDGAFDETWTVELLAEDMARATGHAEIDLLTLDGTYGVTDVDPASFDEVVGILDLELAASAWTGELSGQARNGDTGAASARDFDIGRFR
jgi:hypothetical protein